jgi:hypothetical protein
MLQLIAIEGGWINADLIAEVKEAPGAKGYLLTLKDGRLAQTVPTAPDNTGFKPGSHTLGQYGYDGNVVAEAVSYVGRMIEDSCRV